MQQQQHDKLKIVVVEAKEIFSSLTTTAQAQHSNMVDISFPWQNGCETQFQLSSKRRKKKKKKLTPSFERNTNFNILFFHVNHIIKY